MAGNIVSQLAAKSQENKERINANKEQQQGMLASQQQGTPTTQQQGSPLTGVDQHGQNVKTAMGEIRNALNGFKSQRSEDIKSALSDNDYDYALNRAAELPDDVRANVVPWIERLRDSYNSLGGYKPAGVNPTKEQPAGENIPQEAQVNDDGVSTDVISEEAPQGEVPTDEAAVNPDATTTTPEIVDATTTTPSAEGTTPGAGEAPSEEAAATPKKEDEKQEQPAAPAEQDMTTFNYATGQPLPADASNKDIARTQAANRAGDNLWRLYQEYPNPTDEQIEAAIGSDAFAFNRVYGNKNDNWATAFGSGSFFGRVTNSQRAAAADYIRKRKEYENGQKEAKNNAAKEAHEAQYHIKLGDNDIHVSKDFSDKVKEIGQAYARLAQQDAELQASVARVQATEEQGRRAGAKGVGNTPSPDRSAIKAKRQQVVGALREQLKAAGIDLGPAPEDGEFEKIEDLIASAPDYQTENAIEQALGLAERRTEYNPDGEPVDILQMQKERDERKAAIDLQTRNRELERARNRASFADLAATIGDMTRASQGGRVDPRDWQQMYDNLTAQERANVDNYRTRMQKIEDDIKQQRMKEKQLAAARQAQLEEQRHEKEMAQGKYAHEHRENEADRAEKWWMQKDKEDWKADENKKYRDLQRDLENIRQNGKTNQYHSRLVASSDVLNYGGKVYYYPKGQFKQLAQDMAGKLKQQYGESIKFLQDIDRFKSAQDLEIALRNYLQNDEEIKNKPEMKDDIERMLNSIAIDQQMTVMREFDASSASAYTGATGSNAASEEDSRW